MERTSTVAKFAAVQNEDNRQVEKVIEYYYLAKPYTFWQKINYPEKVDANQQNEKLLVKIAESPYTYLKVPLKDKTRVLKSGGIDEIKEYIDCCKGY